MGRIIPYINKTCLKPPTRYDSWSEIGQVGQKLVKLVKHRLSWSEVGWSSRKLVGLVGSQDWSSWSEVGQRLGGSWSEVAQKLVGSWSEVGWKLVGGWSEVGRKFRQTIWEKLRAPELVAAKHRPQTNSFRGKFSKFNQYYTFWFQPLLVSLSCSSWSEVGRIGQKWFILKLYGQKSGWTEIDELHVQVTPLFLWSVQR